MSESENEFTDEMKESKIRILIKIRDECKRESNNYDKLRVYYERISNVMTLSNTFLSASGIALLIVTQPLIAVSGILSSASFVITQIQAKFNYKSVMDRHKKTSDDYDKLYRNIDAILTKNHMDSNEYSLYIEKTNNAISKIQADSL